MTEQIQALVLECCRQHNELAEPERQIAIDLGAAAPLYGSRGVLDSMALVSLIVAVEQSIEDAMDVIITLADAKAASQENSPFRTVGSLVAYAEVCIAEENAANG